MNAPAEIKAICDKNEDPERGRRDRMPELKPCPFDGGQAIIELVEVNYPVTFASLYYQARCKKCGVTRGHRSIPYLPQFCPEEVKVAKQSVAEEWNRRADNA